MMLRTSDLRRLHGFTLLELTVVLALVTMLLAVATFSLRGPYRSAQFQTTVERIALLDQQLRNQARRFGQPTQLTIDLNKGVGVVATGRAGNRQPTVPQLRLGGGIRIERVVFATRQVNSGKATVHVSPRGQTPTYAVRLRGADGTRKWLVFAGVTGQMVLIEHENEITRLLHILSPERTDAD